MTKILIAGGAGFIGSNLAERLLQNPNNEVFIFDNFQTGKYENIKELFNTGKLNWLDIDVTETEIILYWIDNIPPDEIYHLACPASPPAYQKNPIHTLDTCYIGTRNILEAAKECGAKVLFSSTSETYGEPLEHPQKESYTGNVKYYGSDRSCYDEGKRVAETLCYEYQKLGVDVKVARIFNTFGPKMDPKDGRVVSNFINSALNEEPLTIYGDGSQTRSLCYIDDLLDGLISLMASDLKVPVNLGNDQEITIKELALVVHQKINNPSKIIFNPLPENDPSRRKPDLTLAREKLNYNPKTNWMEGIDKTIKYFEKLKSNA